MFEAGCNTLLLFDTEVLLKLAAITGPTIIFRLWGQNTQAVPGYRLTLSFPRKRESSFLYVIDLEIPACAGMTDLGAFY